MQNADSAFLDYKLIEITDIFFLYDNMNLKNLKYKNANGREHFEKIYDIIEVCVFYA